MRYLIGAVLGTAIGVAIIYGVAELAEYIVEHT